jgi:hypothetical protein
VKISVLQITADMFRSTRPPRDVWLVLLRATFAHDPRVKELNGAGLAIKPNPDQLLLVC